MSAPKLAAAAVAALLLVVWSVRSFVVDDNSTSVTSDVVVAAGNGATEAPQADDRPVAVAAVRGIPVGYPQTRSGASTSAVNWVASFPQLMKLNPLSLQNALVELMSERGAVRFIDDAVQDYMALIEELGPALRERVWIESPLQATVHSSTDTSATVGVWSMVVTGGEENAAVVSLFRTHRIDLVWERGDWKIDEVVVTEGPTPTGSDGALPSSSSEFIEINTWDPAVFADTTRSED